MLVIYIYYIYLHSLSDSAMTKTVQFKLKCIWLEMYKKAQGVAAWWTFLPAQSEDISTRMKRVLSSWDPAIENLSNILDKGSERIEKHRPCFCCWNPMSNIVDTWWRHLWSCVKINSPAGAGEASKMAAFTSSTFYGGDRKRKYVFAHFLPVLALLSFGSHS